MSRLDSKFVLRRDELASVLDQVSGSYRVLEIDGRRWQEYLTRYFDTPGFGLLRDHHRGKTPRVKVRSRTYLNTGVAYLEVKNRFNDGHTVKRRSPTDHPTSAPGARDLSELLAVPVGEGLTLEGKLTNSYQRLTLVHLTRPERVTIDTQLAFEDDARHLALADTAVIEVKQARLDRRSEIRLALRAARVREQSFSKYYVGACLLEPTLPRNRLQPTLRATTPRLQEGVPCPQS